MGNRADILDDTLELALARRLADVVAGAAATETELRLLVERGEALQRTLEASLRATEDRLGSLSADPGTPLSDLASELRRVERLTSELDDVRASLRGLDARARELRGAWVDPGGR